MPNMVEGESKRTQIVFSCAQIVRMNKKLTRIDYKTDFAS